MKNKIVVLLAGLSMVSTSIFAGELNSYKTEVKVNDYDKGSETIEWTLGLGSYKINDNFKFIFDVDRDYITGTDGVKKVGWDTQFGIVQSFEKVKGWNFINNYLLRYDNHWVNREEKGDGIAQYIFSPYFDRDIKIAGKDFNLGVELWAQVGGKHTQSFQTKSGFETNFYLNGDLTDKWNLSLAWYDFYYYNSENDKYEYNPETEDSLTFTLPLKYGVSFSLENYVDAGYNVESENFYINASIEPSVKYSKKVNDNFSWNAKLTYEIYDYTYTSTDGNMDSLSNNDNNEFEASVAFIVK